MLLGWRCRDTVYGEYDLDPLREPALSLVFEGVHDGIYPFKDIIESGKRPREEASEDGENVPGGGEAAEDADPEGADLPDAAGTVQDGESAAEIAASYEEAGDSAVEKLEALPQNAIRGDADKIPDGVCNPVMQAEDYDVLNVAFLAPDDTEYNTDREGIFAKNGIYFALGPVGPEYFSDALFIVDSRTVGLC